MGSACRPAGVLLHSCARSVQQHTAMTGSNPAAGGVAGSCTLLSRRLTCAFARVEEWRTGKTANTSCEVAFTIHCRRQLCCLALSSSVRSRSPAVHCANSCSAASDAQPVVRLGTRLIDAMRQCGCLARQVLGALVASVDVLPSIVLFMAQPESCSPAHSSDFEHLLDAFQVRAQTAFSCHLGP